MNQNVQFEEQKYETAFERFMAVAKKAFGGIPFLVLTVIMTATTLMQAINFFKSFGNGILGIVVTLLPLAMMILTTVGCWLVWSGAKNGTPDYASKLGLVKAYPTFLLVIYYIVTIVFAIAGAILIAAANLLEDLLEEFDDAFSELGADELGDVFSEIGGDLVGIVVAAVVVVLVVLVLIIVRYTMLNKIIKKVKNAVEKREVPRISPMFFCVLSFIFAGFSLLGSLGILLIDPISGISSLMNIGVIVLPAVILISVKGELSGSKKQEAYQNGDEFEAAVNQNDTFDAE